MDQTCIHSLPTVLIGPDLFVLTFLEDEVVIRSSKTCHLSPMKQSVTYNSTEWPLVLTCSSTAPSFGLFHFSSVKELVKIHQSRSLSHMLCHTVAAMMSVKKSINECADFHQLIKLTVSYSFTFC